MSSLSKGDYRILSQPENTPITAMDGHNGSPVRLHETDTPEAQQVRLSGYSGSPICSRCF